MGDKHKSKKVVESGIRYAVTASTSTAAEVVSGSEHFVWDVVRKAPAATTSMSEKPEPKGK